MLASGHDRATAMRRCVPVGHGRTCRAGRSRAHPDAVASPTMTPLGIGIVGTGNIAGGYATDALTHPEIRLVAATDLDPDRAVAFAAAHGCRAHATLDDLLADDEVDIVINLTVHHAHYEVTKRALEAGPPCLQREAAGAPLERGPRARRPRGRSWPSPRAARRRRSSVRRSRPRPRSSGAVAWGPVRAVYAEVNWGRIETWHPAPAPFFDVGVLVDVGVYPLTLVTTMLGPARSVRAWGWELKPERQTIDGTPFRIGSPDLIVTAIELDGGAVVRLTASFYVGRPAKATGSIEFHGDDASLALGNFQDFDATVEVGAYGQTYEPVALVRPGIPRDGLGARRGRDGQRDRRRPPAPGQWRAGGSRRGHPRGGRRIDRRRWPPDRDRVHLRADRR